MNKFSCLKPQDLFGMKYHLVNLYQVCSNYILEPKMARPGVMFLAHLSRRIMGELIVYHSLLCPFVLWVCLPIRPSTFSNISSETTGPIKL